MAGDLAQMSWAQCLESASSAQTPVYQQGLQQPFSRANASQTNAAIATADRGSQANRKADLNHSGSLPSALGQHDVLPSKEEEPMGESVLHPRDGNSQDMP